MYKNNLTYKCHWQSAEVYQVGIYKSHNNKEPIYNNFLPLRVYDANVTEKQQDLQRPMKRCSHWGQM